MPNDHVGRPIKVTELHMRDRLDIACMRYDPCTGCHGHSISPMDPAIIVGEEHNSRKNCNCNHTHLIEKLLPAAMSTITDPSPGVEIDGVVVCPRTRGAKRATVHITCMLVSVALLAEKPFPLWELARWCLTLGVQRFHNCCEPRPTCLTVE